jgi:hypothetical protein
VLEELSESNNSKDLSYLSKLHQSTSVVGGKSFIKDNEEVVITPLTLELKQDQNSNPNRVAGTGQVQHARTVS